MKQKMFLLVFVCFLQAVPLAQPVVPDFRLSTDRSSSSIGKSNSSMFCNDSLGFLITWHDLRLGEDAVFAQVFDRAGIKQGPNFRIQGDRDVAFRSNNQFLSMSSAVYENLLSEDGVEYFHAGISQNFSSTINAYPLHTCSVPFCGTGWLGNQHSLFRNGGHYYSLLSANGSLRYCRIDSSGVVQEPVTLRSRNAVMPFGAALPTGAFAIGWFHAGWTTSASLSCAFFNADGSIVDSISNISREFPYWDVYDNLSYARILALPDTTYLLVWLEPDSMKVCLRKLSRTGAYIGGQQSIDLPGIVNTTAELRLRRFVVTNAKDGVFDLFISLWRERQGQPSLPCNVVLAVNGSGIFTGYHSIDTTFSGDIRKYLFKTGQGRYYFHAAGGTKAYRVSLHDFAVTDSVQINDDAAGSNEKAPYITTINDNTFFAGWDNEVETRGRKVSLNGTGGEEKILPVKGLRFFSDGTGIGNWRAKNAAGEIITGFYYFDTSLAAVRKDTFAQGGTAVVLVSGATTFMPVDGNTFLFLFPTAAGTQLARVSKNGTVLRVVQVSASKNTEGCGIFPEAGGILLIHVDGTTYTYDSQLNNLGVPYNARAEYYIGNSRYLKVEPNYNVFGTYYTVSVVSLLGDVIRANVIQTNYRDNTFRLIPVRGGGFLYVNKPNTYWQARSYNNSGMPTNDTRVIHALTNGTKLEMACADAGAKLAFAWKDTRAGNYDIWANVWKTNDITLDAGEQQGTPSHFYLAQNYPNPFNPVTAIIYSVPSKEPHPRSLSPQDPVDWQEREAGNRMVRLCVYDILGREVATLVNEEKPAGTYSVSFNASSLPSGTYFYELRAGEYTSVRKMILLR